MLYEGKAEEDVKQQLWNKYIYETKCKTEEPLKKREWNFNFATKENREELWKIFHDRWIAQDKPGHLFKRLWDRRGLFKEYEVGKRVGFFPRL